FIKKISEHSAFKDTIIVLFSDHLSMRHSAKKFYPKDYKRKLFWLILNGGSGINPTKGTHMDLAPTILDIMGVKHNAKFLAGNNLLDITNRPTKIDNYKRKQVIKYVNSNFFSQRDYSFCAEEYLFTGQSEIKIGNKNIVSSFEGYPLETERFKYNLAIIAFIDKSGKIGDASIVHFDDLTKILRANQHKTFLLVSPNRKLPYWLNNAVKPDDKSILVLFGNMRGTITNLGSFANLQQVKVKNSDCKKLITTVQKPAKCTIDDKYVASYSNGLITIPRVISSDLMFEGVLKQSSPNHFIIQSYSSSKLSTNIDEMSHCYASHANNILTVPFILNDGTTHNVEMQIVSDKPVTFTINDAVFEDKIIGNLE
ncbi:hypothetical protein QUF50_00595, partial [Thiotrichales bacterium HSG1]|nr:hypothetical protein [Thiotrichales bacterium HSG1]